MIAMFTFLFAFWIPYIAFGEEIDKVERSLSLQQYHHKGIEFTDIVGPFPSNPTYAAVYYYGQVGCNTLLTEVRTGLLNTCFLAKDGTTMKATCSKSSSFA